MPNSLRFMLAILVLLFGGGGAQLANSEQMCLGPSTDGLNGTVDCDPVSPIIHANGWRGYSTEGDSCVAGGCPTSEEGDTDYNWSISLSATDPHVNQGPIVSTLYLWLYCTAFDGIVAAEFGLDGSQSVVSFEPLNGFLNAGTADNLLLLAPAGCPGADILVGRITVDTVVSVSEARNSWGSIKSLYR